MMIFMKNLISAIPMAAMLSGTMASIAAPGDPDASDRVRVTVAPASPDACKKLAGIRLKNVTIDMARTQAAHEIVPGITTLDVTGQSAEGLPVKGLPSFCRVAGRIQPEVGSSIAFEVWLPTSGWNDRLQGVGIGGFAGYIDYLNLSLALRAGQVGVATDTGHTMTGDGMLENASWAKGRPERVRDYGWRAIHLSTVAAKQVIQAFYGHGPAHSYFVGCSGGGRQGLMEASRFPEDYDGVLAGAPAANFTDLAIAMLNTVQALHAPGAAILPEQASFIQSQIIAQCDALDGQIDGLIADPRRCKVDLTKLTCGVSNASQCLTPAQIVALRRIYAGPRNAMGRKVANAYLPGGAEVSTSWLGMGWDKYILAQPGETAGVAALGGGIVEDMVQAPFTTRTTFDFDRDPGRLKAALAHDTDASPDLHKFYARGGKLILWHGWADAAIPPEATLEYHEAMLRRSGPVAAASSRLYMVPGVQHCAGGTGPDSFGQGNAPQPGETPQDSMTAALQLWVERDKRPGAIIGRFGDAGIYGLPRNPSSKQRLLCVWPQKAILHPSSNPDQAASYTCEGKATPDPKA